MKGFPKRRTRIRIVAIAVAIACAKASDDGAVRPPKSPAAATSRQWCWETAEPRAIACSHQTARRSGDTLYVRLATNREMPFIDDQTSDKPGGYHYVGRIPQPPLHVVQLYGHESPPFWIFVDERTGHSALANDQPVISPDSGRFVTAAEPDWNNCTERDHPSLDVWRFTDSLPVLEWRLDPWDCRRDTGWGPTNPRWHGPDTLEFVRNENVVRATPANAPPIVDHQQSRAIAVHDRNGWRIITK